MSVIRNNPFRILGLTSNASERELQKQIGIIKRYAEVGKSKSFHYDFDFIGEFGRSSHDVQIASNKVEQAEKKLLYSLFWFINHNSLDEIAFNNLKDNKIDKAIEIWEKLSHGNVTNKNFSSFLNLGTLYLALSIVNENLVVEKLELGIILKGKVLNSNHFDEFSKIIMRNEISIDSIEISKLFVDEIVELLKKYIDKKNGITIHEVISLFDTYPATIQKYISNKFIEIPLSNIENNIEKISKKRNSKAGDAEEYGEELYKSTKKNLLLLKKIFGKEDVQFQMIANKLANEILQCSIDFFNHHRDLDEDFDPGDDALKVAKYAKSIGATGQTKDRIKESLKFIQEWVDGKTERMRQEEVSEDIKFITNSLENFQHKTDTIQNAKNIVSACKPKLKNIKNVLGSTDELYLQLSSLVVNNALSMVIEVVNNAQNRMEYDHSVIHTLPATFSSAVSALNSMNSLDMLSEIRGRFNSNRKTIKDLNTQLERLTKPQPTGGCYIATMAYGDYDHPQVMHLRKFRDDILSSSMIGRSFIKIYYAISPYLVQLLKNQNAINGLIRNLLDKFIEKVK